MNADVEFHIKNGYSWTKLPAHVKQAIGNSQKEYDKCVIKYSIQNQLRHRGNLVRHVKKDEKRYYEDLLQHSRQHLMLYPYHLSDVIVKGLRITPFSYYLSIMEDIMTQEKSYDSLPNFTAADCLRLLGIGRNQYIELMNQCRSSKKFFRRRPVKDLLPPKPVSEINIEPWWHVQTGYITEDDIKLCATNEKNVIDDLIDKRMQLAGQINFDIVHSLYQRGLIYLDVPIMDDDCIVVPPLEGFVMNRVLGDYFETLLYKIFVSIDEHTNIGELARVLEIDPTLVKNAVSVFCRLGFARRKNYDNNIPNQHASWASYVPAPKKSDSDQLLIDWDSAVNGEKIDFNTEQKETLIPADSVSTTSMEDPMFQELGLAGTGHSKRIALLFDSTLTAFLMMGNLSPGLKNHAVTMFEVGKLSDESMDSFLAELEKVGTEAEGEAQRYFDHAVTLRSTIRFLRYNRDLSHDPDFNTSGMGIDLLRCQSLLGLDPGTCARILNKNYSLLVSMAPLSNEIRPVSSCTPQHIGPAIPEVNSIWFKLFIYALTESGPPSLLLVKGTRLNKLPGVFQEYDRLLVTVWGHDPGVVSTSNVLLTLNDALSHSAVLIQAHGYSADGEVQFVPFPIDNSNKEEDSSRRCLSGHPAVQKLSSELHLDNTCGFISMLRTGHVLDVSTPETVIHTSDYSGKSESSEISGDVVKPASLLLNRTTQEDSISDWVLLDCSFGIPLFDMDLNRSVCDKITSRELCKLDSLQQLLKSSRKLSLKLLHFISEYQDLPVSEEETGFPGSLNNHDQVVPFPVYSILYKDASLHIWEDH